MPRSSIATQHLLFRSGLRVPAVRRVRELLRAAVIQERFRGDVLPSELELVSRYDVSRGVIREVLELLRGEALIERLQGAGTFVIAPERSPITIEEMGALPSSIDEGFARVTWDLLELVSLPAPELVAERLALPPNDPVVYAERVTNVDGEPVSVRSSWLPHDIGALLLEDAITPRQSVYELVEDALGHAVSWADLRVEAVLADSATASVLRVAEGVPLLLMERLVYDVDGRPVEYGFGRTRADRMALTTVMRRHGDVHCTTYDSAAVEPRVERPRPWARTARQLRTVPTTATSRPQKGATWEQ